MPLAGPGRLPYHHTAILHYCNLLGVRLEVYTMMTRANYFQNDAAKWDLPRPKTNRRIANDTRGYISELLAKCPGLDAELTADKRRIIKHQDGDLRSLTGGRGRFATKRPVE